jgi:hypothetical protein
MIGEFKTEMSTVYFKNIRQYCNILNLDLNMFNEFERKKIDQIYSHDFKSNHYLIFHLKQYDEDDKILMALFFVEKDLNLNMLHVCYLCLEKPTVAYPTLEINMCRKLSELVKKEIVHSFKET